MKLRLFGALLLPVAMHAGILQFGNASGTTLTFTPGIPGTITWSGEISGTGSLSGIPLNWTILETPSDSLTWTGSGSPFALSQGGNAVTVSVNDGLTLGDSLAASVVFSDAINTSSPSLLTDLQGTATFTSVNIVTGTLVTYLDLNFGGVPTVGMPGTLDLVAGCGTTAPAVCLTPTDPTGSIVSADLTFSTATTPEPGTMLLIGCGIAGLVLKRRLAR
jgi:hypothetical protein